MSKALLNRVLFLSYFISTNLLADPVVTQPSIKLTVKVENHFIAALSWSDYIPGKETRYNIYVSNSPDENFQKMNYLPYKETGFGYGCTEKRDYYFLVKPIIQLNPLVEGPSSNVEKVTMTEAHPIKSYKSPITKKGPASFEISIHHSKTLKTLVRVLDDNEKVVRIIKDGDLNEDQQTLSWDGKTEKGSSAPAGTYLIEIKRVLKSGTWVEQHEVQVTNDL